MLNMRVVAELNEFRVAVWRCNRSRGVSVWFVYVFTWFQGCKYCTKKGKCTEYCLTAPLDRNGTRFHPGVESTFSHSPLVSCGPVDLRGAASPRRIRGPPPRNFIYLSIYLSFYLSMYLYTYLWY